MSDFSFFSATLGFPGHWSVAAMSLDPGTRRLDLTVRCQDGAATTCPHCGAPARAGRSQDEIWYRQDYFNYAAFLHVRIPRFECHCGATFLADRPWQSQGSRFVRLQ